MIRISSLHEGEGACFEGHALQTSPDKRPYSIHSFSTVEKGLYLIKPS